MLIEKCIKRHTLCVRVCLRVLADAVQFLLDCFQVFLSTFFDHFKHKH